MAAKKAARKATPKKRAAVPVRTRAPAKRAKPKAAAVAAKPPNKVTPQPIIEQDLPDEIVQQVRSQVVTDLGELRQRAMAAMGEFADEAQGQELFATMQRRRAGTDHIWSVHPLDLHVLSGAARINPRDFQVDDMVTRVAELTVSVAGRGVLQPMVAFIQRIGDEDRLVIKSGETRLRATLHAWMLKDSGLLAGAPRRLGVQIEDRHTNDVRRVLDFGLYNDTKSLSQMELAMLYQHANGLGADPDEIAKYMGKSVSHVKQLLSFVAAPQAVLNLVRHGVDRGDSKVNITLAYAHSTWIANNKNTAATVAAIQGDASIARAVGATKVMPRHKAGRPASSGGSGSSSSGGGGASRSTSERSSERDATLLALKELLSWVSGLGEGMAATETDDGTVTLTVTGIPSATYLAQSRKIGWPDAIKGELVAEEEPAHDSAESEPTEAFDQGDGDGVEEQNEGDGDAEFMQAAENAAEAARHAEPQVAE